jgi:hypothetical protein
LIEGAVEYEKSGSPGAAVSAERRSLLPTVLLVWGGGVGVFALGIAAQFLLHIPLARLTRDPLAVVEGPFYTGAISNLGVLAWAATATICIYTFFLLPRDRENAAVRGFLLYFGLFTALLMADDLFLLHEDALYGYLGVPEPVTYGVYGLLGLIGVIVHRRTILRTDYLLLGMALALFAFSLVTDLMPVVPARHVVEDGSKLVWIFAWFAYLSRAATASLGRAGVTIPAPR